MLHDVHGPIKSIVSGIVSGVVSGKATIDIETYLTLVQQQWLG